MSSAPRGHESEPQGAHDVELEQQAEVGPRKQGRWECQLARNESKEGHKGNAGKDEVLAAMRKRGHAPADDNEADALAILFWAAAQDPQEGV